MKYVPVQVLEAPRPKQVPADFIDWQFAFYRARILSDEMEDQLCQLLTRLLLIYLQKRFGRPLKTITRQEAQNVADDINSTADTILSALADVLLRLEGEREAI